MPKKSKIGLNAIPFGCFADEREEEMPRQKKTEQNVKLNICISQSVKDRIKKLQEITGAETMAEVIRYSLAAYETMLELKSSGNELLVKDGDEYKKIILIPMSK